MSLTKEIIADKIEVIGEYRAVQVRTATIISEDGEEVTRKYSRHIINAGDDYSQETQEVQSVCSAVHTDAVVNAYKEFLSNEFVQDDSFESPSGEQA